MNSIVWGISAGKSPAGPGQTFSESCDTLMSLRMLFSEKLALLVVRALLLVDLSWRTSASAQRSQPCEGLLWERYSVCTSWLSEY